MLEAEIQKLNENIAYLNRLLEAMADTAKAGAQTQSVDAGTPQSEPEPEPETEGFTHKDIKDLAMVISRKDREQRNKIKAKLQEHDAKVATDLNHDATQVVGAWLTDLKDELGV